MKVGDIIKLSRGFKREACACTAGFEVVEDFGLAVKVRCIANKAGYIEPSTLYSTVRKRSHYVFKTLEKRLEDNDLQPVMGTNR